MVVEQWLCRARAGPRGGRAGAVPEPTELRADEGCRGSFGPASSVRAHMALTKTAPHSSLLCVLGIDGFGAHTYEHGGRFARSWLSRILGKRFARDQTRRSHF